MNGNPIDGFAVVGAIVTIAALVVSIWFLVRAALLGLQALCQLIVKRATKRSSQRRFEEAVNTVFSACVEKLRNAHKDDIDVVGVSISSAYCGLAGEVFGKTVAVNERVEHIFASIGYEVTESLYGDELIFRDLRKYRQCMAK